MLNAHFVTVPASPTNVMIRIFVALIQKMLSVRCVAAVAKSKAAVVCAILFFLFMRLFSSVQLIKD